MNYIAELALDEFEALCIELMKEHAEKVCDPSLFAHPSQPHYSDFDPAEFRFAKRANNLASIYVHGYLTHPGLPLNIFVGIWHCKYFNPEEFGNVSDAVELSKSIVENFVSILNDFDKEFKYGILEDQTGVEILYTVITNAPLHPALGSPSLYGNFKNMIDSRIRNVSFQIGTAETITFQSNNRRIYAVSITPEVVKWLSMDPYRICKLSPDQFE